VKLMTVAVMLLLVVSLSALPPEIARAKELTGWIHDTIPYVATPYEIKSPADTLRTGGDCADLSALLITLLRAEGIESEMYVMVLLKPRASHAVVKIGDYYFDSTTGETYSLVFPRPHIRMFTLDNQRLLADWESQ